MPIRRQTSVDLFMLLGGRGLLPRDFQIRLRRLRAQRILKRSAATWPINAAAGQMPPGWPGWPRGRPFALVLTHDVDTRRGLARCEAIMALEERLGFRSAFNFVPRGRYAVPVALRENMVARGFEVGVHGLYHDWWTFLSRRAFRRRAPQINQYLREWGAVGFRAPSMISNADWMHGLDIEYDGSSFDTDPFEPQPIGVGTCFPFRVPGPEGQPGYIELPYTLPQDFTLFVLLQQRNVETWITKLRWLAEHRAMALLNVHPDYTCIPGERQRVGEYPLDYYEAFLEHVRQTWAGAYWNAPPREVARYANAIETLPVRRPRRRVAMVAYAMYDNDNRIIRYAEALAQRGDTVDVIAVGQPGQPPVETINGVQVLRVQTRRRDEKGQGAYLRRILLFLWRSMLTLSRRHWRAPYDLVHVHSVPDFEVFAAWFPRLMGARVILDIHDIMPEFYISKFGLDSSHRHFRTLLWVERMSAAFADHVIIANDIWREKLVRRSVPAHKVTVVLNAVDTALFAPRPRTRTDDRFIMVYPGGFQWHQGLDIAIRAFARNQKALPRAELHLYGDGPERATLTRLIGELGLAARVTLHNQVAFRDIPDILANADLGIVAKRACQMGDEAASTKIAEYLSQDLPALVPRTKVDTFYFDPSTVRFFDPGNEEDMAVQMHALATEPALRASLVRHGRDYVAKHCWNEKRANYLSLVDGLVCNVH